jgi:hypothetical protein
MTGIALVSSIILSAGSLAWVFFESGMSEFGIWILIFGAAWLFSQWRGWGWFSSIGLFLAILVSAFGLWFGLTPGWMFSGAIFALAAWDLTDFRARMRFIAADDHSRGVERRHLARISLLSLAGLALATITMIVRVEFTVEWGALLVVAALLGLGQLAGWFRRQ